MEFCQLQWTTMKRWIVYDSAVEDAPIISLPGLPQGDPGAPLVMTLLIYALMKLVEEKVGHSNYHHSIYMDDRTVVTSDRQTLIDASRRRAEHSITFSSCLFSCYLVHLVLLVFLCTVLSFLCSVLFLVFFVAFAARLVFLCSVLFLSFFLVFPGARSRAISWLVSVKTCYVFHFAHLPVYLQRQTYKITFFQNVPKKNKM